MINNPKLINQIKDQIKNLSPELLNEILNEVEEQEMRENQLAYQMDLILSVEMEESFFDFFTTYSTLWERLFKSKKEKQQIRENQEKEFLEAA